MIVYWTEYQSSYRRFQLTGSNSNCIPLLLILVLICIDILQYVQLNYGSFGGIQKRLSNHGQLMIPNRSYVTLGLCSRGPNCRWPVKSDQVVIDVHYNNGPLQVREYDYEQFFRLPKICFSLTSSVHCGPHLLIRLSSLSNSLRVLIRRVWHKTKMVPQLSPYVAGLQQSVTIAKRI